MAGITPVEGQDYIAEVLYSQGTAVQSYTMGLFVNTTGVLTVSSAWADVTQASGAGYAEKPLTPGTFTISTGGVATYPSQSWIATGSWALPVYGYYIRTQEGTPRILHFEYSPNGSRVMDDGDIYSVDLSTNTE
jgi:hypothetical protein